MEVKKQQLELDMKQQTGSKSGKEYIKAVYCHTAYLTYAEYILTKCSLSLECQDISTWENLLTLIHLIKN